MKHKSRARLLRASRPLVLLMLALSLPVMVAFARPLYVRSLTLASKVIVSGGNTTGFITLDGASNKLVTVSLASHRPEIVAVPSSVTISALQTSARVTVNGVRGAAGCTYVGARVGSTPGQYVFVTVVPPPRAEGAPDLRLAGDPENGHTGTGTVIIYNAPPGTFLVTLNSSAPETADVPAKIAVTSTTTALGQVGTASFRITSPLLTQYTACAVISATYNGVTTRALYKLKGVMEIPPNLTWVDPRSLTISISQAWPNSHGCPAAAACNPMHVFENIVGQDRRFEFAPRPEIQGVLQ